MMALGKCGTLTKADKERFRLLQEHGCAACRKDGYCQDPDIHHILRGGNRMGHQYTIPLCPYHHRGINPDGRMVQGPTLCDNKREFVERYGTEMQLLDEVNYWLRYVK